MPKNRAELLANIEDLHASLDEYRTRAEAAEDALRAIQCGEVDALVISGPGGERVYTLEGADQIYRVMVEQVQEGVATMRGDGIILYANQRLAHMLCIPLEKLLGSNLVPFISLQQQNVFGGLLRQGLQTAGKAEINLQRSDGSTFPALLSLTGVVNAAERFICLVASDLSEQKRHEEILASEKFAYSILEQASDAIVVCDPQGTVIRANQAAHRLVAENPLFQPFARVFPLVMLHDGRPGEKFSIQSVLKGRVIRGMETRLEKFSPPAYVLLNATTLLDEVGSALGCIVALTDITARKQIGDALRESEKRFRELIRSAPTGIYEVDFRKKRFISVNDAMCLLSGYSREELLEMSPFDILDDAGKITFQKRIQQWLAGEKPDNNVEYRVRAKDGHEIYTILNVSFKSDEQGRPVGATVIGTDITERRRIETALHLSEQRFRLALKNSPTAVYQTDTDLRYTWIYNPRHGYSVEQMIGKRDADLFPAETIAELVAFEQSILKTRVGARSEIHFPLDGVDHIYDITADPLWDADGNPGGLTVVATNITELVRIREQAQAAAAQMEVQHSLMDMREQERQQIARDLHDGPVQGLLATTFALQCLLVDDCAPELAQQIEAIRTAIQEQVSELRAYAGELRPPTLIKFGLVKAIQSHLETFQEKHPRLRLSLEHVWDGPLLSEEVRLALFRIFQEGLNNIAKHANASQVTIRLQKTNEQVCLEIHDDGAGFAVPADWLDLVHQEHLGLVGMRERAEAIGGRLEIRSRPGEGSTLSVSVPLQRDQGLPPKDDITE